MGVLLRSMLAPLLQHLQIHFFRLVFHSRLICATPFGWPLHHIRSIGSCFLLPSRPTFHDGRDICFLQNNQLFQENTLHISFVPLDLRRENLHRHRDYRACSTDSILHSFFADIPSTLFRVGVHFEDLCWIHSDIKDTM